MDGRTARERVAANVAAALEASGASVSMLSEATDLTYLDLEARLAGVTDFTFQDLVQVGGFFRIPASRFLEGVA
jgi:hypothetical protein